MTNLKEMIEHLAPQSDSEQQDLLLLESKLGKEGSEAAAAAFSRNARPPSKSIDSGGEDAFS